MDRPRASDQRSTSLQLRLAFADVGEFVEKFGPNISEQGVFVRSRDPRPVGSRVSFELKLKTGEIAFAGAGIVRYVQLPDAKGERVPGMGLAFETLSEPSRTLVGRVTAARAAGQVAAPVAGAGPASWRPIEEIVPPPEETFEVVEETAPPPVLLPALALPAAPVAGDGAPEKTIPLGSAGLSFGAVLAERPAESGAGAAFDVPVERRGPAYDVPPTPLRDEGLTGDLLAGALGAAEGGVRLSPAPTSPDEPENEERTDPMFAPGGAKTAGANLVFAEPADDPSRLAKAPASAPPVVMVPSPTPAKGVAPAKPVSTAIVGIELGWATVKLATASGGRLRSLALGKTGELSSGIVEVRGRPVLDEDVAGRTYRNVARLLGQYAGSLAADEYERRHLARVAAAEDGLAGVVVGGQAYGAAELVGTVLAAVRERASAALGGAGLKAAFVVPASASAATRHALREAAEKAGIGVDRLVSSPLALCASAAAKGRRTLVVEYTESRFEASIVEAGPSGLQLVATAAAPEVGTIEIDLGLTGALLEQFEKDTGLLVPEDAALFERVRLAAARAKEALGDALDVEVHVPELVPMGIAKAELRQRLTRAKYLGLATPQFERALEVVREVLQQRGLGSKEIDQVVVAGSGSRLPAFVRKLAERLGKEAVATLPPEAAVQGAVLVADAAAGPRTTLVPGVGATLVVALPGGGVRRLFERGAKLPAERSYSAIVPEGASQHELFLFQGERTPAYANELVGVAVAGPLAGGKGPQQVTYVVAMNDDGDVAVRARDTAGREVPVTLERRRGPEAVRRAIEGR